jgi:energy-coupling factor transporter ATP-binding protein EcfA2
MSATRDNPLRRQLEAAKRRSSGATYLHLPEDCPVTPLGGDGNTFFYLNANQQLVSVEAQKHSKNVITALFAPHVESWCYHHYPKTLDPDTNRPKDFKVDALARDLMCEAQERRSTWRPQGNVRGAGVWPGEDGDLRVHLGDRLLIGGQVASLGRVDDHVYPLLPAWQGPAEAAQPGGVGGPADELLALFGQWRWQHQALAPRLLLGWCMAGFLCGALDWRPHVWLLAPRGSGKSTLLKLIGHLMQRDRYLLQAGAASSAAVRGLLRNDARPVSLDEQEPSEDNRAITSMLELVRLASTGDSILRSSVDQTVSEQQARFAGIFASIVKPPFTSQDASRITVLRMLKPAARTAPPLLRGDALELLGRRLFRRLLDRWKHWPETRHAWTVALAERGMDNRFLDQVGTLLALAWLVEQDQEPDSDSLDEWCSQAVETTQGDRQEERPQWFRLVEMLSATMLRDDAGRTEASVAELLDTACFNKLVWSDQDNMEVPVSAATAEKANATLARHGLRFVPLMDQHKRVLRRHRHEPERAPDALGDGAAPGWVAIANAHPGLARVFDRTQWAARPGTPGGWKSVLEDAPGAVVGATIRFGPRTARCVQVPVELFFDGVTEHE